MPPQSSNPTPAKQNRPATDPSPGQITTAGGQEVTAQPSQSTRRGLFKKDGTNPASTQNALLVSEVRDGLAIMRDGSFRSVVMCHSINFDLMSPGEREAVEFSYQGFLNSLYFPIQIFIRSQRVDLNNYLEKLQQIHTYQENILLGLLMEDYINYVRYLVEDANVMDKQFYVVVPYYPPLITQEGIKTGIGTGIRRITSVFKAKPGPVVINEVDFNKYKTELAQRVQVVVAGLGQVGIQAVPLDTQELIELYYMVYNPQTAANQRLVNAEGLETAVVERGTGEAPQVLHGEENGPV